MDKAKLLETIRRGTEVILEVKDAEVVSIKKDVRHINKWRACTFLKFVAVDPKLGPVWFSTSADKFWNINLHDKISLKVKVTGVGDPSDKYPDPILFCKPALRGEKAVEIIRYYEDTFTESIDIGINV